MRHPMAPTREPGSSVATAGSGVDRRCDVDGRESHVPSPGRWDGDRRAAGATATHTAPPTAGRRSQRSSSSTASTPDRPARRRAAGPWRSRRTRLRGVPLRRAAPRQSARAAAAHREPTDRPAADRQPATGPGLAPRPGRRLARRLRMITVLSSALVLGLTGSGLGPLPRRHLGHRDHRHHRLRLERRRAERPARRRGQPDRRAGQGAATGRPRPSCTAGRTPASSTPTRSCCCTSRPTGAPRWPSPSRATAYVDIPGLRRDKINAAYPAKKAEAAEQLRRRRGSTTWPGWKRSPQRPAGERWSGRSRI